VSGVKAPSREQILKAAQIIVGAHRKDYNEALIGAINAKLDAEEKAERLRQDPSREAARLKYRAFIDGSKLPEADADKLIEMMSEDGYASAVETAQEMKASRIYTFEEIVDKLTTLTPERLKEICEVMEKPELLIVSDQSFDATIANMDGNKHYTKNGASQENAYVHSDSRYKDPYDNPPKPESGVVVVNGVPHQKHLTFGHVISRRLSTRREKFKEEFSAHNMRHIKWAEMAALMQKSLIIAQKASNDSLIVDNLEYEHDMVTIINPDGLTDSEVVVAFAYFDPIQRRIRFSGENSLCEHVIPRGRASMQIL
jgi:hypothetical protein